MSTTIEERRRKHDWDWGNSPLIIALKENDFKAVRREVAAIYSLELGIDQCEVLCLLWQKFQNESKGVGGTHLAYIWVKSRLLEQGAFPTAGCPKRRPDGFDELKVEMHSFFIFLEETAEMLLRLRKAEKTPEEKALDVARSPICDEVELIFPVNSTAAIVTNFKDDRRKH